MGRMVMELIVPRINMNQQIKGFVALPIKIQPWQQKIYEKALQEAQAVVRPSILERLKLTLNN
jgi:hypothetical protein